MSQAMWGMDQPSECRDCRLGTPAELSGEMCSRTFPWEMRENSCFLCHVGPLPHGLPDPATQPAPSLRLPSPPSPDRFSDSEWLHLPRATPSPQRGAASSFLHGPWVFPPI